MSELMLALEIWLPVVGYEGLYEVSNLGRVKSLQEYGRGLCGGILKQRADAAGRMEVKLYRDGRGRTRRVHRLVAEAFVGPLPDGQETRHLNDVPGDNWLVNLAYGTSHENKLDMLRNGRHYEANVTHCGTCGTPYDEANTMYRRDGRGRGCRACHNAATARRRLDENMGTGTPCTADDCEGTQVALGLCRPCYTQKRAAERRGPDWEKRTCPQCGIDFERELAPGQGKRKFCSDACRLEFKRIAGREAMRARRAAAKSAKAT